MSTKIESTIRQIGYPQASVYAMLSDLSNIDRVRDRLPEDKIKDLSFDTDSISISTQMGAVKLVIVEREELLDSTVAGHGHHLQDEAHHQGRSQSLYQWHGEKAVAGGYREDR